MNAHCIIRRVRFKMGKLSLETFFRLIKAEQHHEVIYWGDIGPFHWTGRTGVWELKP